MSAERAENGTVKFHLHRFGTALILPRIPRHVRGQTAKYQQSRTAPPFPRTPARTSPHSMHSPTRAARPPHPLRAPRRPARRGMGLVTDVFHPGDIDLLPGDAAIGHTRYSTAGGPRPPPSRAVSPLRGRDARNAAARRGAPPRRAGRRREARKSTCRDRPRSRGGIEGCGQAAGRSGSAAAAAAAAAKSCGRAKQPFYNIYIISISLEPSA